MMRKTALLALIMTVFIPVSLYSQDDVDYRYEIGPAIGGSFYRGELNHKFFSQLCPALGVVMRRVINPYMAVKATMGYAGVKGSTDNIAEYFPADPASPQSGQDRRYYSFNKGVVDLSVTYEYNFWPFGLHHGYQGRQRITPFLQIGLGGLYATAGKTASFQLPIGAGVKYKLKPRLNLGLDCLYHFTLTDKVDGFESPHGITTTLFRHKDDYCTAMIYITYDFSPRCPQCNKND